MDSIESSLRSLMCFLLSPWVTVPGNAIVAYYNWGDHWEKGGAGPDTRLALGAAGALAGLALWGLLKPYCKQRAAVQAATAARK